MAEEADVDKVLIAERKLAGLCELCGDALPKSDWERVENCVNQGDDWTVNKECLDYKQFVKTLRMREQFENG